MAVTERRRGTVAFMTGGGQHSWQDLVLAQFHRVHRDLSAALDGADRALLDRRPAVGANSVGWLAWRIARGQDRNLSELLKVPQLWLTAGWSERFGRPADAGDTGYGHSPAEAAAFRGPAAEVLSGYLSATYRLAQRYLARAPDDDLRRSSTSPTLGNTHTVAERLTGLLAEGYAHAGQVALLLAQASPEGSATP
ncbi:DinB family protein [Kitasatospora sp. NBC_01287]|uniref:DinB family protein n=1 Tax=Kitasatospora sp. NBC_01287 TaxID=2903573 RepID=UPI002251FB3B|nr:DinB family protein [Kitasatospora sp. NBC_01287]MCX4748271.1 DinB family protein [Kitasatospora sp. NBC_01287]